MGVTFTVTTADAEPNFRLTRRKLAALLVLAVLAYGLRFLSSWWLLEHAGPDRFDPHGFGVFGDVVLLAMLAPVLTVLLLWIIRRRGAWRGLFASASAALWFGVAAILRAVAVTGSMRDAAVGFAHA